VSGVTGVVEKPIQGAKSAGLGGFFGGIGKGLIGAVTKPTAGIVDFASQSLEGIRKYKYKMQQDFSTRKTFGLIHLSK
jgi:vacuolar protein sorting-associated protein 13A/C